MAERLAGVKRGVDERLGGVKRGVDKRIGGVTRGVDERLGGVKRGVDEWDGVLHSFSYISECRQPHTTVHATIHATLHATIHATFHATLQHPPRHLSRHPSRRPSRHPSRSCPPTAHDRSRTIMQVIVAREPSSVDSCQECAWLPSLAPAFQFSSLQVQFGRPNSMPSARPLLK